MTVAGVRLWGKAIGAVSWDECAGLAHFEYKKAGAHSYEQALRTIRKLGMPMVMIEEQFRRMAFNSYNPQGDWTSRHQMPLNGIRDNFSIEDYKACAKNASMKRGRAEDIVRQVQDTVLQWKHFPDESGVSSSVADGIAKAHRTDIVK